MQLDDAIAIPPTVAGVSGSQRARSAVSKGKTGEREALAQIVIVMQSVERNLGMFGENAPSHSVQRNLQQAAVGGCDIVGIPALAVEVKRQEASKVDEWWSQACASAAKMPGHMPVLMYRRNREKWTVRCFVHLRCPPYADASQWYPADLTLTNFLAFYAEVYSAWLLTARSGG